MKVLQIFLLTAGLALVASADKPKRVEAEYCALIGVHDKRSTEKMMAKFDEFAKRHSLEIDDSDPVAREYRGNADGSVINFTGYLGPYGAVVSFFPLNDSTNVEVLNGLRSFVSREIAADAKVALCGSVEGFENPVTYR